MDQQMHSSSETIFSFQENVDFISIIQILEHRSAANDSSATLHFFHDDAAPISETDSDTWSWKELLVRARAVAAQLVSEYAVEPGSRVLVVYPAGLGFMAAFYGCLYAGIIPVPVPPPRRSDGLNRWLHISGDADIAGVVASDDLVESLQPLVSGIAGGFCAAPHGADPALPCLETASVLQPFSPSPADIAFLQYTSGSTSDAKGVMVTHGNMMANLRQISIGYELTGADRMASWLPHYHDMGLIGGILSPLYDGYSVAYMSPASFLRRPLRFLALATHFRATLFGGPNFSYDHCVRRSTPDTLAGLDLSTLRIAFTGAETIRPETLSRFADTFGPYGFHGSAYLCCYGMAEATLFITGIKPSEEPHILPVRRDVLVSAGRAEQAAADPHEGRSKRLDLAGSGRAVDGLDLSIVDPLTGKPRPEGQVGEVWVRGPNIAAGYWRRPDQTAETFGLDIEGSPGWFRTGDLGFLRADQLFITGRLKDMIIIRGENHYPQDIEMTASSSHPDLAEGQAGAVALDIDGEERLGLVCEVTREAFRRLNPNAVFEAIRSAVARTHTLQIAVIALIRPGNLPRTPSGKVRRFACRQGLEAHSLPLVARWDAEREGDVARAVPSLHGTWRDEFLQTPALRRESVLRRRLQVEIGGLAGLPAGQVPPADKGFFDLGLDSVAVSSFAAMLERETGLRLGQTVMFEHPTIESLAAHLCMQMADQEPVAVAAASPGHPAVESGELEKPRGVSNAIATELAALRLLLGTQQGRRHWEAEPTSNDRDGENR